MELLLPWKFKKLHVSLSNIKPKLTGVTLNRVCSHGYKILSDKIECVFCVCMHRCDLNGAFDYVEIMLINHC